MTRGCPSGEPSQHAGAQLLHRREIFSAQRYRLGEAQLSVIAHGKHRVDHPSVKVHMHAAEAPDLP